MIKTTLAVLAVGSAFFALNASQAAADAWSGGGKALGGDCCADLEERVAELEATTVRKGNKKVTVTLSGQVNKGLMFWDDGAESNLYVIDNDQSSTRFRFRGKAKISEDWEAGYRLEFQTEPASSAAVDQLNDNGSTNDPTLRYSSMYIKSKKWGEVDMGFTDTALKGITKEDAAGLGYVITPDFDYARSFFLRPKGFDGPIGPGAPFTAQTLRLGAISGCYGDTTNAGFDCSQRTNVVRYTTPDYKGFYAQASWGEDDWWDVALKVDETYGNFKVMGGIGYGEYRDERERVGAGGGAGFQADREELLGSISAWHKTSGLFAMFSYAHSEFNDSNSINNGVLTDTSFPDGDAWHIQAGVKRKWNALGDSSVFGFYSETEDMLGGITTGVTASRDRNVTSSFNSFLPAGQGIIELTGAKVDSYGFGMTQDIEAAAMNLYAVFQWYDAEVDLVSANNGAFTFKYDELFTGIVGARISF